MQDKYLVKNKNKIAYRIIDGEAVIVNIRRSTFHTLNSLGTFIWEKADGKTDISHIILQVQKEFDVDHDTAKEDCIEFINDLVNKELCYLI